MPRSTIRVARQRRSRATRRGLAVGATTALVAGLVTVGAGAAQAAVPDFPDNVVVFPDRDFVTLEGYQDYLGQNALVEVKRPGVGVIGSAIGKIAAGDVAFEINHPGGYCWGAGTGVDITPDIQGGDVVSITIGGVNRGETTVSNAHVTGSEHTPGSSTLVVNGQLGPEYSDPARLRQLEQRIVNPDLTDTAVNRRDVRAVTGGLAAAPKGGYLSNLETSGTATFRATYQFDTPELADLAAGGGGFRMMSWQVEDAAANRQGLTIAELGEAGGPGFGGCPNGPLQAGPPAPTNVVATKVSGGYKLTWDPAAAVPGTPAITGYQVTALAPATGAEQATVGRRVSGQGARSVTIPLDTTVPHTFEIVSVSSTGLTFPPVAVRPAPDDVTAPVVSASPPGGSYTVAQSVTLTSNEPRTDIYFTIGDNKHPLAGADTLAPDAAHYTGPVAITANATLRWVGFDLAGNVSTEGQGLYVITNTPPPAAPQDAAVTASGRSATVTWTSTDPSVTGFTVTATPATGSGSPSPAAVQVPAAGPLTATFTGLTEGVAYTIRITATNPNGTTPVSLPPFVVQGAVVADAGPDLTALRGAVVTLTAADSAGQYQWQQLTGPGGGPLAAGSPDTVSLTNAGRQSARFTLPTYRFPMSNGPLTFRLTVTRTTASGTTTKTDEVQVTPRNDRVVIADARYKATDFRMSGTATTVGATVTIRNATTNAVIGTAVVTAAAAPATGGAWELRLRNGVPANPGRIVADSSQGGTSAVLTVA